MVRDLREAWEWIGRLTRRVERVESGAFLENSSITAGRMRFIGGLLLIDSGGTLQVIGTVTGAGTFDWTGPMNLQGAQTITGPTTFTGQMTVNGPWALNGDGDIAGNVTVLPGGKIQVGSIIIDPTISGGAVTFANGAQVFTDGSTIQVYKGNSVVQVSDGYARLQNGGDVISVGTDGVRITGHGTSPIGDNPGSFLNALIIDGSGYLRKIVP